MPPKTKRQRLSAEAASLAREKLREQRESEAMDVTSAGPSTSAAGSSTSTAGPSTSTSSASTPHEILAKFSEEWVKTLDRDDKKSLALFLCSNLSTHFQLKDTEAAELVATMIGKSDRTVRQWRTDLIRNDGVLPESMQGRYQRNGVLWYNEELSEKAKTYVRLNASVKGTPNMTTLDFCKWVNKSLLPNSTLEPAFPRKISVETARRWLLEMGFEVITPRKGIFIDGHEREDVVEDRKVFLRRMVKIGFLHFTNAPTEAAQKALPTDVDPPTLERRCKTVVIFHDESAFTSNEDQSMKWGVKGEKMMKQKK